MFAFFRAVLRDKWKIWGIYVLSALGCLETYVAIYPSMASQASSFTSLLQALPEQFYTAFNMSSSMFSFNTLEVFLSSEYMSLLWPIMAILLAIPIANYLVAGDIDKGTMESIAALPASRIRLFVERYAAGLFLMESFTAITILMAIPLASVHRIAISNSHCFTAFWCSALFSWVVYSLAVATSTISSEGHKAGLLSGGILLIMYVMNVLAGLTKDLENLKYFSFFHYFNGTEAFANDTISRGPIMVMITCSVILTIFSVMWFRRRNLSV